MSQKQFGPVGASWNQLLPLVKESSDFSRGFDWLVWQVTITLDCDHSERRRWQIWPFDRWQTNKSQHFLGGFAIWSARSHGYLVSNKKKEWPKGFIQRLLALLDKTIYTYTVCLFSWAVSVSFIALRFITWRGGYKKEKAQVSDFIRQSSFNRNMSRSILVG